MLDINEDAHARQIDPTETIEDFFKHWLESFTHETSATYVISTIKENKVVPIVDSAVSKR